MTTAVKEKESEKTAKSGIPTLLLDLLADTYTVYVKTQNYHWNVTGPQFKPLHELFEAQYKSLLQEIDDLAERIRTLGAFVPATMQEFRRRASIAEATGMPEAEDMIVDLVEDNTALADSAQAALPQLEEEDQATMDMLVEFIQKRQKAAWMLKSSL